MKIPTRERAEEYLSWAGKQNPGPWTDHSRVVANACEKIAENVDGMNSEKAYILGLLHDIGRYKGVTSVKHIYDGYKLMLQDGYDGVAQICLTHSFPLHDFTAYAGGENDCTQKETEEMIEAINTTDYTEYDRLVQLCDSLAMVEGICLMEKRLMDVAMRYGVKPYSQEYWKKMFEIRDEFSNKIGSLIYSLFPEVAEITLK